MPTTRLDVNDPRLRDAFLRESMFQALAALREETPPLWGRMRAQQMVEHLLWAFELSTGRARALCPFPVPKQERYRAFLYDNGPTPHEFMNPALVDGLPPLRHPDLAAALGALRAEAARFLQQAATNGGEKHNHPLFGMIGDEEWERTHYKHCHHHLLQFGLLDDAPQAG